MKELPKYPGYYITKEGDAYRKPVKGERMPINENGLVYLKPGKRGHPKYPEKQYDSINITIRDENGKFVKQIKQYNHRLVAETFVPNPQKNTEILHIDENPSNNHYTNLKWGTHKENLQVKCSPEGTITYHSRNTKHPDGYKRNPTKYIKKNGEWVLIPSNRPSWNKGMKSGLPDGSIKKLKNGYYNIKENGVWVYMKKKDYFKYGV